MFHTIHCRESVVHVDIKSLALFDLRKLYVFATLVQFIILIVFYVNYPLIEINGEKPPLHRLDKIAFHIFLEIPTKYVALVRHIL